VQFKRDVKARNLSVLEVQKLRLKQQSRLTIIRATEVSDKLFYLRVHTNEGFA
jgi:hypothetical protein